MKYTKLASILFILLFSCIAKNVSKPENETKMIIGCPENGKCKIERIENSKVVLFEDSTGQFYPKTEASDRFHLYKFSYNKAVPEMVMDAHYQEVIYFQIEKDKKIEDLKGKALDKANVIYGRLCRCPGDTGYEAILSGSLYVETRKQSTEIRLQIEPKNYSTILGKVEASFTYKN